MKDILFLSSTFESKLILEDNQSHLNEDVIFLLKLAEMICKDYPTNLMGNKSDPTKMDF